MGELKPFLMSKLEEKSIETGQHKWRISLKKMKKIFGNLQEIHLFNFYKFDDLMLADLIEQIQQSGNKLRRINFLYYDYLEADGAPTNESIFMNPNKLNKRLLNKLNDLGWT